MRLLDQNHSANGQGGKWFVINSFATKSKKTKVSGYSFEADQNLRGRNLRPLPPGPRPPVDAGQKLVPERLPHSRR
jgi:hypothetical protein